MFQILAQSTELVEVRRVVDDVRTCFVNEARFVIPIF